MLKTELNKHKSIYLRRPIPFLGFMLVLTPGMISFRKPANKLDVINTDAGKISGVINTTGDVYAFKGIEIHYTYHNLKFSNPPWQPGDHQLAEVISFYWANFAAAGNPNGKGLPEWKPYHSTTNEMIMLNNPCYSAKMPDLKAIEFLAAKIGVK
jgi:hypothetical protein